MANAVEAFRYHTQVWSWKALEDVTTLGFNAVFFILSTSLERDRNIENHPRQPFQQGLFVEQSIRPRKVPQAGPLEDGEDHDLSGDP